MCACVLTCVGALDEGGLGGRLGCVRRCASVDSCAGGVGRSSGLLDALHGHKHTRELLQGHGAQLGREWAGWVFQTHQPAGVA